MKIRTLLLAVVLGIWVAPQAGATTLVRMSLSQLAQASSTIVRGQVVAQTARWNPAHTRIMTYTTVQLSKAFKGRPPATLTVEQPGGTAGNFHVRVPGTAFLRPQTDYVLFLQPAKGHARTYHMVGMMQGAFRIYSGRNRAGRRVLLPLGSLITGRGSATLSRSPSLGEFQAIISDVLAAPMVIPVGTAIPVVISSTQFQGAGQSVIIARTTSDLFPSRAVVVPAGSRVVGTAQREGTKWKIYWTSVSVRGYRAHISASNETSVGENLRGQAMVIQVMR